MITADRRSRSIPPNTAPDTAPRNARVIRRRVLQGLVTWSVLFFALAIWEGWVRISGVSALVLPGPLRVLGSLWENLRDGYFLVHIRATVVEVALGFVAGSALGIALGAALFHFPQVERIVRPYIVASQALPKLALAPIFVLWFGFDLTPKVFITTLIVFFPLLENTLTGLASPTRDEQELFRSLRASQWQTFWGLRLPSALPFLFAGLRIGAILSIVGATVSEYVGANRGLGALIIAAQGTLDTPLMFAVFVLLTVMGLVFYALVTLVEWFVLYRRYPRRSL